MDNRDWPPSLPVRRQMSIGIPELEMPKPDGWWFCDPPTREEIRFRLHRTSGRLVATFLSCPHGTWTDLTSARAAHSIEAEE